MSHLTVNPVIEDMFSEVSSIIHQFVQHWEANFFPLPVRDDPNFDSDSEATGEDDDALRELYERHNFMEDMDMGNLRQVAGLLVMSRQKHVELISNLDMDPANRFDHAVAYAVVAEVADGAKKHDGTLSRLLELVYTILYRDGVPKPRGTMSLESLILESESKLLSLRELLLDWLEECDGLDEGERRRRLEESEKYDIWSSHVTIVSFMGLLCSQLGESRSWRDRDDLDTLHRSGFRIVHDFMQLDRDHQLPEEWRVVLMRTVLTWLDISHAKDVFLEELIKEPAMAQLEICLWRDRFNNFFRHFPGIFDGEFEFNYMDQVDQIRTWAEHVEFRDSLGFVGMHAEE
ncbi:hypothetical protein DHEL01_v209609 [Diaporthe helianthi]|uniref:Uncharacterized protein n=1 Tax=Diaporthe helianthi TaxID=158607 RepID=A0A2P5HP24_DIAHE|nr:hypothetical protein DHEL01_v209609 [Diaporthe helianthi]